MIMKAKEPWQMTKGEFSRKSLRDAFPTGSAEGKPFEQLTDQQAIATADAYFLKPTGVHDHEFFVRQALSEGKSVPAEVLKDYPDLIRAPTAIKEAVVKAAPVTPEITKDLASMTWYRGTKSQPIEGQVVRGDVSYFTNVPEVAKGYAKGETLGRIIEAELLFKNPKIEKSPPMVVSSEYIAQLKKEGYDALIQDTGAGRYDVITFKASQVKAEPAISKAEAGMPETKKFVGYRHGEEVGKEGAGTFYSTEPFAGAEGITREVKLSFKNPLELSNEEIGTYMGGLPSEYLVGKWFPQHKSPSEESPDEELMADQKWMDRAVAEEAVKRGYDAIIYGTGRKAQIQDLASLATATPEVIGEQIARELGIKYDGVQEGIGMQFTDPQTGSTTYGNTLEEIQTKLIKMRAKFAKVTPAVPKVGISHAEQAFINAPIQHRAYSYTVKSGRMIHVKAHAERRKRLGSSLSIGRARG